MPIHRAEDVYNLRVWKWATSPTARVMVSARTGRRLVPAEIRTTLGQLAHRLKLREMSEDLQRPPGRECNFHQPRRRLPRFHGYALARAEFAPHDELDFMPSDVRDGLARLGIDSLAELLVNQRSFYLLGLTPTRLERMETTLRRRGLTLSKG